ncbi:polysaccharide biosynthesis C-terminal domain-containing protein [Streptococcus halotolerans]|uniref:oligosaccharide flippase family protein n=1 Tax=Streptococcus halotolerans TaxID=1814128 RepID=UPI0007882F38|nr:polysaccharide biosynthesis C-terminal domain-containing protein [Streptococcus halotolerans]
MKLVKNMFYNASYQILALILPLLTVPYVSRVLSPEGIGINAYTNSIVTYFSLAGALGIALYGNREIAFVQKDRYQRSKVFWELVLLKFLSTGLASLCFLIFISSINKWHSYFLLQGLNLLAVMFDISWYFQGVEDFKKIVIRNTIVKFTTVALTFILINDKNDLGIYIFLITFSMLLGNLTVWPFLKNEIQKIALSELEVTKHLLPTIQLFLPQITMQIYLSLNKSMLGSMDSVISAGFFDQSDKIVRILFTIVSALGGVFLPRLSSLFSEGKKIEAKRLLLKLIDLSNAISLLMIGGIIGVSSTFAIYFFGKDYAPVGPLMAVQSIMILFISYGNALGTQYLLASKRTKPYTLSAVAGLITNIILNIILIPVWGAMGATVSTVITEFIVSLYQAISLRDTFTFKELTKGLWKYAAGAIIVAATLHSLRSVLPINLIGFIIKGLVGSGIYIIIILLLKAPIFELIREFRKKSR